MKNQKQIGFIISFVLCCCVAASGIAAYASTAKKDTWLSSIDEDAYVYPITPENNKEKWASLKTNSEKTALLQIPEDSLTTMSTKGLLATCLQYPGIVPLFAFNSPQRAMERLIEEFNGFKELQNRQDVGDVLIDFYSSVDLALLQKSDRFPAHRLLLLEYILAQPSVMETVSDKEQLIEVVYEKMMLKQDKYMDVFSTNASAFVLARAVNAYYPDLMLDVADKEGDIKRIIETGEARFNDLNAWEHDLTVLAEKIEDIISKATPHNSLRTSCLLNLPLYRPKILGKPKCFPAVFERSDENSGGPICTPELCGVALNRAC